jgi:hypothetical protein
VAFHALSAVTGLGLAGLVRDLAERLGSERWTPAAC